MGFVLNCYLLVHIVKRLRFGCLINCFPSSAQNQIVLFRRLSSFVSQLVVLLLVIVALRHARVPSFAFA